MAHFCEHLLISQVNGGMYCKHETGNGGAYCVYQLGSRFQAFDCPKGFDGYPKWDPAGGDLEMDDIIPTLEQLPLDLFEEDKG